MARTRLRRTDLPSSLRGWILVNDSQIPRYWATVWADILKADIKEGTRGRHLAAIEKLYRSVAAQTGRDCLDSLIAETDFDGLEAVLGGFLSALNNEGRQNSVDRDSQWRSAVMFLSDVLRHISHHANLLAGEMQAGLHRLERLYAQIRPVRPASPTPIRALPAAVIEDLYRLFDPNSSDNPFRTPALKSRNFLIFIMLLHLGLRRSEAAILTADAIKEGSDPATGELRFWIDVDEPDHCEDQRYEKPSLKTDYSRRQLPVSEEVVKIADSLVQNYRRGVGHVYLFASQKGNPLALRSFSRVFEVVTAHLSPQARKALEDQGRDKVTAHDLRHTCAVYRISRYRENGDDIDTATEKLRVFFGWSHTSEMPRHYARAYFETRSAEVWNDSYDSLVASLRSLEGILA